LQQSAHFSPPDHVIRANDLHKVYLVGTQKVHALRGIDLTIEPGEFCAIVGASGSGKSTLLNMMAGLERPSRGEITIAGMPIHALSESQLVSFRRQRIGFVFQSFNLLPMYTALENVALPLVFRGMGKRERMEKAANVLKMVGLVDQMEHRPSQLSGGQQQRVGIARALVADPAIVFADEPTGNLDSATSAEVMELMNRIVRKHHQTLVMVTHDASIAAFADRCLHIRDGKISLDTNRGEQSQEEQHEK
jgi:putative ABC transport system ATP-binding protein